ncbi:MAG: GxxExxY protein [Flavobacteriaceae bacterium]|jgi:GxxExxY protein|nr:GxxExxY protein [Flavobacteriaceae bacterium]
MKLTKTYLKDLTYQINGAAIEVHKEIGAGLLESVYQKCMMRELEFRGIDFKAELKVPLYFKGIDLETEFRCDLFVENCIVVELKSVKEFAPIYEAQILTYMRLLKAPKGILYNFNSMNLYHEGQKSFVNHHFSNLEE